MSYGSRLPPRSEYHIRATLVLRSLIRVRAVGLLPTHGKDTDFEGSMR
jgi:hypothetical protein